LCASTVSATGFTKASTQHEDPQQPTAALRQLPFLGHLTYALHRQAGGYYNHHHHHHRCHSNTAASLKCTGSTCTGATITTSSSEHIELPGSSLAPVRTPAGRSGSSAGEGPSTPPQASGEHPAASFGPSPAQHTLHEQQQGQADAAPHPTQRFLGVCISSSLRKGAAKVARAAVIALPIVALGLLVSRRGGTSH
jgi:hypothetical protein